MTITHFKRFFPPPSSLKIWVVITYHKMWIKRYRKIIPHYLSSTKIMMVGRVLKRLLIPQIIILKFLETEKAENLTTLKSWSLKGRTSEFMLKCSENGHVYFPHLSFHTLINGRGTVKLSSWCMFIPHHSFFIVPFGNSWEYASSLSFY